MNSEIDQIWAAATDGLTVAWEVRLGRDMLAAHQRDLLFSGASMVKTLLAALIDEDVRAGTLELSRPIQVTKAALVGDDGLLRFGQIPTMHRLGDLILLMVSVSDNTATNTLIAFLGGPEAISMRFAERGWASRLHTYVGSGTQLSTVSLHDHQTALASITTPVILAAFAAQQDRRALARRVDYYADFRHKTGTVGGVRHDAGVLLTPKGLLWVGCFTDGGPEAEWVDHPAGVAMGAAMRDTLVALDLEALTVA